MTTPISSTPSAPVHPLGQIPQTPARDKMIYGMVSLHRRAAAGHYAYRECYVVLAMLTLACQWGGYVLATT